MKFLHRTLVRNHPKHLGQSRHIPNLNTPKPRVEHLVERPNPDNKNKIKYWSRGIEACGHLKQM